MLLYYTCIYCQLPTLYQPVTADKYDANNNEYDVQNTGNDLICGNHLGFTTHVTVCDGDRPHFIWWDDYTLTAHYTEDISDYDNEDIIDPDVVLFESYDNNNIYAYYAIVVYQTVSGEINYVVKRYDLSDPYDPHWEIDDQDLLGYGANPNIDASIPETSIYGDNKFAITWENNGYIKAYVGDFYNGALTNQSSVLDIYDPSQTNYGDGSTPDVTISYTPFTPTYMVSFTFNTLGSPVLLAIDQEDFDDILGNSVTFNLNILYEYTDYYGRPRIASPDIFHGGAAYDVDDYEIVVDADDATDTYIQILGFNKHFGTPSIHNYEYTYDPDWIQQFPVVCYSGDQIFASWVLYNIDAASEEDIVQIVLGNDGTFNTGYYSQVNMDDAGTQSLPSISAQNLEYIYYSFMDFEDDHIKSKVSISSNQQLKICKLSKINVFPNPASESIKVISDAIGLLKLIDIKGQIILIEKLTKDINTINLQNLPPGIYQVQYITDNSIETQNLIIY